MPYRHRVYTVLFIWILIACTGAKSVLAADTTILNARILPTIWFSDLTVQAGDTVRIYGAIQNNAGQNISGSAQFYLDQELFTAIDFTSTNNSLKEISIPWIAVVGEHTVHISLNADLPASTTLTSITSDEATIRVLKPASTSTVTQIILETTKNIIEKTDALASDVTTALSDLKKDLPGLITPSTTPSLARGTTTETTKTATTSISWFSLNNLYNTALDSASFLITHWKWTAVAGIGLILYIMFARRRDEF